MFSSIILIDKTISVQRASGEVFSDYSTESQIHIYGSLLNNSILRSE